MGNHEITVVPVQEGRRMEDFLRLPWQIQEKDPCWVAPILSEQKHFMDPASGPFFEIGEAQYFVAYRDGRPAGRITAQVNHAYEKLHDDQTGFFGFFECIRDQETATALFDTAANWLREKNKSRIQGPMNFSIYDEIGLLVEGFDSLPAFLQTHNPPYYEELVSEWGFKKAIDWYALYVTNTLPDREGMKRQLNEILQKNKLVLGPPDLKHLMVRTEEVYELFNEAWSANWGHVPLTRKQFSNIFKQLKPLLRADLITVILDGDSIAAFIINIADINPTLQKMNGDLSILNQIKLYYDIKFKPLHKIRTLLLGVKRKYQRRNLHMALILNTYLKVTESLPKVDWCDCSLIPATLYPYIKSLEDFGARRYKTWRIYEREI